MSELAIKAENLGKLYRIGARAGYKTIRESIIDAIKMPFRRNLPTEKSRIWALRNVSFEVKQGQAVGIIGKNGSGKSTLLKILSRITRPTEGNAIIHGRVASLLEVGTGFHPELTGRENINLNAAILGMSRDQVKNKMDAIIDFAGETVKKFIDTPVKRYSSGMYVRLAFAIAAHLDTDVLLIDEVLAVGDAEFQKKCLGAMGDVASSGRTVIFVSHSMDAIRRLCNSAILIENGHILASGDTNTIVDCYYKKNVQIENNVVLRKPTEAGSAHFVSWQLGASAKGEDYKSFTREQCMFKFKLVCDKDIEEANFGFSIRDSDENIIWTMRSLDYYGKNILVQKGEYEISFLIPNLPVKPGVYRLRVSIYQGLDKCLDLWYVEPDLIVLPREETGLPLQSQGIISIPGQFNINKTK